MMAGSVYAIVEFISSNSVAIVPVTWLTVEEDQCFWPPKSSKAYSKLTSIVKRLEVHDKNWEKYAIKVLGKAGM